MAKLIIHTNDAPKSLAGYSQAVKIGGLIFVSGQEPFDPGTGEVLGTTIQEQTGQCLRNIEAILCAAGSSLELRMPDVGCNIELVHHAHACVGQYSPPAPERLLTAALGFRSLIQPAACIQRQ